MARKSSAGKGSCQSWLVVEERQASARIVAVLGGANRLTARRSTAARSALKLHALLAARVAVDGQGALLWLACDWGSECHRSSDWVERFALELANV
jgi:hypothetical protein